MFMTNRNHLSESRITVSCLKGNTFSLLIDGQHTTYNQDCIYLEIMAIFIFM